MTWEYKLEVYDGVESVAILNRLGEQGWELCGVRVSRRRRSSSRFFYLKRPKQQETSMPLEKPDPLVSGTAAAVTGLQAGIWRHYKGGYYQVLGVAAHSETDERMVVYVSLSGIELPGPRMRVRPLSMWFDEVTVTADGPSGYEGRTLTVPRFTYIGPELI